jgi:cyanosortase A-associated protein
MILWQQIRNSLLAVTFGGVLLVLGKLILTPTIGYKRSPDFFVFPPEVPLSGWQPLATRPLPKSNSEFPKLVAGRHYRYQQNGLNLDIEMRYFTASNGDVRSFIHQYAGIAPSLVVRQHKRVGFYGFFVRQQRAYLSVCINPRGGSTVTAEQFEQNRYLYDISLNRLLPWLLGQEPLRDNRCLWAHLSIAVPKASSEAAYKDLEKIWFSWYNWWNPRFPKP